jgi:hypothetical protein
MTSNSNLDSLLDVVLDDLKELPEFKPFQPGAHKVLMNISAKEIGNEPAIELAFKLVETIELADTSATPDAPGQECSTAYQLNNEFGQGSLRKALDQLSAHYGVRGLREIAEATNGVELLLVSGLRQDKKDKDRQYLSIKSLTVI